MREGKAHGQDIVTWPDGRRYEGEFLNGLPHGQGVMSSPDGKRIEGEFRNGKPRGRIMTGGIGSMLESSCRIRRRCPLQGDSWAIVGAAVEVTGELQDGRMHGRGIVTLPDGTRL